jgi:CelD/BcsL family acetyltransferase involved in cellulose biosynthesis
VLEPLWRRLEAEADASFFTSWTWIGTWLAQLGPRHRPRLLRATQDGQVVGLALLTPGWCRRLKLLPSRALHLHATGERCHDDIAIEHNGLLVRQADAAAVEAAMLAHLCEPHHRWDQLRLPGVSATPASLADPARGLQVRQESSEAYRVDLAALRQRGQDHLSQIGRNTRAQIRRSWRDYAALGPLHLTAAADAPQALHFLERLKHFHQKAWNARGDPGAFGNPRFERFHRQLVGTGFPRGEVQLLRVHADEHDIGYLYNFVRNGHVSCYQSGFNYGLLTQNHHPGLAVHAQAIQHCSERGLDVYDFLAGAARYKQQLSTERYAMAELSIHRDSASLRLEQAWRGLKQGLRARLGRNARTAAA